MTTFEIRRHNLRLLALEIGHQELAHQLGYASTSFLSQMIGPHHTRRVSEITARKVEQVLDLPPLWLDQVHDPFDPGE